MNRLNEDFNKNKVNVQIEIADEKPKTIAEQYLEILPKKGLTGATKTNYEKILDSTRYVDDFTKNDFYVKKFGLTSYPKEMTKYIKDITKAYFKSFEKYIKSGKWSSPKEKIDVKYSQETIELVTKVLNAKHYNAITPDVLDKVFKRFVKNYDVLKPQLEAEKKAAAEAEYKALHPEHYEPSDTYNPDKLNNHVSVCKGENSFISQALTKRHRLYYFAKSFKNGEKYVYIKNCLDEIMCACDNAFFSAAYNGEELDFSKANEIEEIWRNKSKEEKLSICSFLDNMASTNFAVGGSCGLWSYKDCLSKALTSRQKVTGADEKEAQYKEWSDSIDKILDEEGTPSLTKFLTNWVNDMVKYYKSEANINNWNRLVDKYTSELNNLKTVTKDWNWRDLRNSEESSRMKVLENYISEYKYCLNLSKTSEDKLTAAFEKEADAVRRDFITKVCEVSGKVIDGTFYWGDGGRLDGTVNGEKCNVSVHSFFAGGYNIQRLHVRTRISIIKD